MSKNRTNNRGKVVEQWQGYNIRKMINKSEVDKFQTGIGTLIKDKGYYGIYAGKNLIKDGFKQVENAIQYCRENLHKK